MAILTSRTAIVLDFADLLLYISICGWNMLDWGCVGMRLRGMMLRRRAYGRPIWERGEGSDEWKKAGFEVVKRMRRGRRGGTFLGHLPVVFYPFPLPRSFYSS